MGIQTSKSKTTPTTKLRRRFSSLTSSLRRRTNDGANLQRNLDHPPEKCKEDDAGSPNDAADRLTVEDDRNHGPRVGCEDEAIDRQSYRRRDRQLPQTDTGENFVAGKKDVVFLPFRIDERKTLPETGKVYLRQEAREQIIKSNQNCQAGEMDESLFADDGIGLNDDDDDDDDDDENVNEMSFNTPLALPPVNNSNQHLQENCLTIIKGIVPFLTIPSQDGTRVVIQGHVQNFIIGDNNVISIGDRVVPAHAFQDAATLQPEKSIRHWTMS